MSSSSADNDSGTEEETINQHTHAPGNQINDGITMGVAEPRIVELLQEEGVASSASPQQLGSNSSPYKAAAQREVEDERRPVEAIPNRSGSPVGSLLSIPDDTPSIHVSWQLFFMLWH